VGVEAPGETHSGLLASSGPYQLLPNLQLHDFMRRCWLVGEELPEMAPFSWELAQSGFISNAFLTIYCCSKEKVLEEIRSSSTAGG